MSVLPLTAGAGSGGRGGTQRRHRGAPIVVTLTILLSQVMVAPGAQAAVGGLDTTFDSDGWANAGFGITGVEGRAVKIQPDGRILALGTVNNGVPICCNPDYDWGLARFESDGSLDTTFSADGKLFTNVGSGYDLPYGVAIDGSGNIVVAGQTWDSSSTDVGEFAVARYESDGDLDTTFDGDGVATLDLSNNDELYGVAVQSDDKVVAVGRVAADLAIVRYKTDGTLDSTFDGEGYAITDLGGFDIAFAVAIQPDGKIVVAGFSSSHSMLARYNTDGSLDSTFDGDGRMTMTFGSAEDSLQALAIQPDGGIVAAGYKFISYNSSTGAYDYDFAVARFESDGDLDLTFDVDGKTTSSYGNGSDDRANGVAIDSDGNIVVAGYTLDPNTGIEVALARYGTDGSPDSGFGAGGLVTTSSGGNAYAQAVAIQSDDKIVTAGRNGGMAVARFKVTNTTPIASDDGYVTDEDQLLSVAAPGVLDNDDDDPFETLTASLVVGPSDADSFTLDADGSFDYMPALDFNGSDSFTYKANDGTVDSNAATVTITVDPVPEPDLTSPTDPVLASPSHTTSEWSNDRTIDVTFSGAADAGSGVDGFSFLWDTAAATLPDQVKDAEETAPGTTSPSLADGSAHYFHLRTRDNSGNWTATAHLGPFWIDGIAPTDPSVASTSHTTGAWSNATTVDLTFSGASDATSGVDGFSYIWTTSSSTVPDQVKDAEQTATGTTSPPLADDSGQYFHLRTRDNAGNWTSTVHLGPFRIDGTAPTDPTSVSSSSHTTSTWSQDRTVPVTFAGASDAPSGVDGFSYAWSTSPATVPDQVKDAEQTATGTTSPSLADGSSHYFHLRTRDNAGNWTSTVHFGPFWIDDTAPTGVQIDSAAFASKYQASRSFPVSWTATDATSGVASYSARYRAAVWNGGFGSYVAYAGANGATFTGSAGRTYCFDVLATDAAGNGTRSAARCTSTPLDDRSLTASSGWSRITGSVYYLNTSTRTTTKGAKLTRTGVRARRLALLATKCSTCGTVDVYLGSTFLRRISLTASTTLRKQVIGIAAFTSTRTGTVTVKVVSSSGRAVSIDGLNVNAV